jgi:hypothetical protein
MLRRSSFVLLAALLLQGCPPSQTTDAGTDAGVADAGTGLKPCLDAPTDLPRPPGSTGLPCELIPPGFAP